MTIPEPSLRQQLLEARANIQRQIDLLRDKPYPFPVTDDGVNFIGENSQLMDKLKGTLREIEESLAAGLGRRTARPDRRLDLCAPRARISPTRV